MVKFILMHNLIIMFLYTRYIYIISQYFTFILQMPILILINIFVELFLMFPCTWHEKEGNIEGISNVISHLKRNYGCDL